MRTTGDGREPGQLGPLGLGLADAEPVVAGRHLAPLLVLAHLGQAARPEHQHR
jgi:hypothetical protein